MLDPIQATRFIKRMGVGRTKPCLFACEKDDGAEVEVVVKFSGNCFEKEKNLALEAIVAMLGADLNLPVPEPFIVLMDEDFIHMIEDRDIRELANGSSKLAFGSKCVPPGFAVWGCEQKIPEFLTNEAAEIFVFDAIVVNSDRRPSNPNCLYSGKEVAIIDHELALGKEKVLFWKAPWLDGGFDALMNKDFHIFAKPYFEVLPTELNRFVSAWEALPNNRFNEYKDALPVEWMGDAVFVNDIIAYLQEAKANIRAIAENALRILK